MANVWYNEAKMIVAIASGDESNLNIDSEKIFCIRALFSTFSVTDQ